MHLRTPEWSLAGASAPGLTGVAAGHNGFAAWGVTNGSADVVDLFIEEIGPDGESVLGRDGFEACEVREERIGVRGGEDVVERVLITPRGPVISPALPDPEASALSMRAVFLEPLPIEGFLALERVRSFEQFRARFAAWPVAPFNLVYGDVTGAIGWHFAGDVPRRQDGEGLLPRPGRDAGVGWEDGMIEAARMPWLENPQQGFVATANNKPVADGAGPWLGADWMDGYRVQRLAEALGAGENWDVASSTALQLDRLSLPWRELRDAVLDAPVADDPRARRAVALLSDWDGVVDAGSPAAAVFELFLAELTTRAARSKAPRAAAWALGRGANPLLPHTYVALRWVSKLSGLLRERPEGWFAGGWDAELAAALATAVQRLEDAHGADPAGWAWGGVRPLTLRHPLGDRRPFDRIFNLGPIPYGGDANTPAQASNRAPRPHRQPGVHRHAADDRRRRRVGSRPLGPGRRPVRQPAVAALRRPVRALAPRRGHPDRVGRGYGARRRAGRARAGAPVGRFEAPVSGTIHPCAASATRPSGTWCGRAARVARSSTCANATATRRASSPSARSWWVCSRPCCWRSGGPATATDPDRRLPGGCVRGRA